MNLWTEIVNTALLGCGRKTLSLNVATGDLGVLLSQLDQNDSEGALLGAAAIVSLYERAVTLPMKDTQPLPAACEPDDAPRCGEQEASRLATMLSGDHRDCLPEWLTQIAARGKRLPEKSLAPLLEHCRLNTALRKFALPALGRRGRWLATQNPAWSYAAPITDERSWHLGNHKERLAFLIKLRAADTARSRELLASTWNEETADHRAEFLSVFEIGLSFEDEQMLESALDDSSKGVARTAAQLLIQIPQSRLRQRMIDRARSLIRLKKGRLGAALLVITPPKTCDDAMSRDGIRSKPLAHHTSDQKAWLAKQIVSLTPPSTWNQLLGLTADELAQAALTDIDLGAPLLEGWVSAAKLHRDDEWGGILCLAIFNAVCQYIGKGQADHPWHWVAMLDTIALRLDPPQIPEAVSKISASVQEGSKSETLFSNILATLQFRHEMLQEINQ